MLSDEMGAHYKNLLYRSEIRWLSRSRILSRVAELSAEILHFVGEGRVNMSLHFLLMTNSNKNLSVADIFSHVNELDTTMQGFQASKIENHQEIAAFKWKFFLLTGRMKNGNVEIFKLFSESIGEEDISESFIKFNQEHTQNRKKNG